MTAAEHRIAGIDGGHGTIVTADNAGAILARASPQAVHS